MMLRYLVKSVTFAGIKCHRISVLCKIRLAEMNEIYSADKIVEHEQNNPDDQRPRLRNKYTFICHSSENVHIQSSIFFASCAGMTCHQLPENCDISSQF